MRNDDLESRPQATGNHALPDGDAAVLGRVASAFIELGYGNATMAQLAQAAGTSEQALITCYTDKESLLRMAVDSLLERARRPFMEALPDFDSVRTAAEYTVKLHKRALLDGRLPRLANLVMAEAGRHPEIADVFATAGGHAQSHAMGEHTMRMLMQRGLARPCNPAFATRQFYGMLNQVMWLEPGIAEGNLMEELDEYLADCVDWFCSRYSS